MKAMLLAAGYGKRLLPLTLETPKPLLKVAGKPLLQHHIERLAASGIRELVINTSWLAQQIEDYFGDGSEFGVSISWSRESEPLETGGGITNAIKLLGEEPFLVVNGDVWSDYPLGLATADILASDKVAWLLMVENPQHNSKGDYGLVDDLVNDTSKTKYTFSGISIMCPQLFIDYARTHLGQKTFPLRDVLNPAIKNGRVVGTFYDGKWCDVGTLDRYQRLNDSLRAVNS